MNYSRFFNFISVFNEECFYNNFNEIYDNTSCKNLLSFSNFIEIFNDFIQLFYKHDFDNYIILFHNNEIINDINKFVNKNNFDNIVIINEIFNFLLLDEYIYKKYILFWISYFNFNENELEKIKNNELYNQINNICSNNVLVIINMYVKYNDFFNSFDNDDVITLKKYDISFNLLTILNNNNYNIIVNILNNNDGYINYKKTPLLFNNENNDDLYVLHNIFNCENDEMYEYEIANNENDYKYNSSLCIYENVIEKCLYYNKTNKYINLTGDEKFILNNVIKKHKYINKRDAMIKYYNKNYKQYFNNNIFCNKNISDYILIVLNRFNENNYLYFPKELSNESKDKIINYIFIAGICNNFELVKYIVRFYKLIGKEITDNYKFNKSYIPKNIYNYLLHNKVINVYQFKHFFNYGI